MKSATPGSTTPCPLLSASGNIQSSRSASWSISSPRNPSSPKRPPKRSRKADPRLRKRNPRPSNQEKTPCPTWAGCVWTEHRKWGFCVILLEASVHDPTMGHRFVILCFGPAETASRMGSTHHDRFRLSHTAVSALIFNPSLG